MKTVLLILLCLIALQSSAISISENINISDNGTGAACESEGVYISFGVGSFVDDGDGNDYYARAVVDARGVVMSFNESSIDVNSSTIALGIPQSLSGITARPLTFVFFDKLTTSATPGGSNSGKYNYAVNNYQIIVEHVFDPVEVGVESCETISELYCHDPLIYKSGVEALSCGVNDDPMANFTSPLGTVNLCIPPTTFDLSGNDFEVCNTSCSFGGTGCDLQLDTQDLVNFTESQLCATYTYSAPNVTVNNNFFGNCEHNIEGDYYIGTFWEGSYSAPFSWLYTMPDMVMKWFNVNYVSSVGPGCNFASALNNAVESYIASFIQNYYQNHFTTNESNVFCEIVE